MPEPVHLEVVVGHLHDQLGAERLPAEVLAARSTGSGHRGPGRSGVPSASQGWPLEASLRYGSSVPTNSSRRAALNPEATPT